MAKPENTPEKDKGGERGLDRFRNRPRALPGPCRSQFKHSISLPERPKAQQTGPDCLAASLEGVHRAAARCHLQL